MKHQDKKSSSFDKITQILLPALTLVGFFLISFKYVGYGLAVQLVGQVFWVYVGWRAWKEAGQIGAFVTTILVTLIIFYGVLNYFVLSS